MYKVDYSGDDQVLSFKTKKEAVEFMHSKNLWYFEGFASQEQAWSYSGACLLSKGEYARPEYVIRRYKDGWGIKIIYFYDYDILYAPKDRRAVKLDFEVMK